jgi:hypothetical protein
MVSILTKRSESQKKADKAFSAKKVRLEVVFNPDNEDDVKRIAKLAAMPDKSRAVKEWLDSLDN